MLDLESYVTAFNYMRRYAAQIIKKEEKNGLLDKHPQPVAKSPTVFKT